MGDISEFPQEGVDLAKGRFILIEGNEANLCLNGDFFAQSVCTIGKYSQFGTLYIDFQKIHIRDLLEIVKPNSVDFSFFQHGTKFQKRLNSASFLGSGFKMLVMPDALQI